MAGDLPFEEILVIHQEPTATVTGSPRCRGSGTAAWEPAFADGWHGWWNLNGGKAAHGSYIHAVGRRANFLDVFVVGLDGRVYTAAWSPGHTWGGWWPMGR
jgi:hypothetical protein